MTGRLRHIITASDPATRNQSLDAFARAAIARANCWPSAKTSKRSGIAAKIFTNAFARCFFSTRCIGFICPAKAGDAGARPGSVQGLRASVATPFRGSASKFFSRRKRRTARTTASPARSPAPITGWASKRWPTRCGAACVPCAATNGCSAWAIPPTSRCASGPSCCNAARDGCYPILRERTPVRMDLTHSAWSDIFFLGMDFPEGARVLNVSVDLGVKGRHAQPEPPIEVYPARDRRAGAAPDQRGPGRDRGHQRASAKFSISRKIIWACSRRRSLPPGLCRRASKAPAKTLPICWHASSGRGRGLELVSNVNNIPKGSRLAVSTNLLASLDFRLHARDRPGQIAFRPVAGRRTAAGAGARNSGRMARRFGRRLAGFGRRLARHEIDPGRAGGRGRSGIRHEPRPPDADASRLGHE